MLINMDYEFTHCVGPLLPQHHATLRASGGHASTPVLEIFVKGGANDGAAARTERAVGREILCRLSLHHAQYDIRGMLWEKADP